MVSTSTIPVMKFRSYTIFTMSIMVAVQLYIFGTQVYSDYNKTIDNEKHLLSDIAEISGGNITNSLRSIELILDSIGDELEKAEIRRVEAESHYMSIRAESVPEVKAIYIVNKEGKIIDSTTPASIGINVSERGYFIHQKEMNLKRRFYIDYGRSKVDGKPVIFLSKLYLDTNGNWKGLVCATVDIKLLNNLLSSLMPSGDGSTIFLVSNRGDILSRAPEPDKFVFMSLDKPGSQYREHLATGNSSSFVKMVYLTDGIERYSFGKTVADGAFIIFISKPTSEILTEWRAEAYRQLLALVMWIVVICSLSALLIHHQGRALSAISDAERSKQNADAANRAKSTFLANMGHELRTPLNSIIGFAQLIQTKAYGPLEPEYTDAAHDIQTSGWHLLSIVNDILDYSKIEAGKMTISQSRLPAEAVIRETLRSFRLKAAAGNITLSVISINENLEIWADEKAFRHILLNLVSNAIKFTPPGGAVSVTAEHGPNGGTTISVIDTGIGIPSTEISRLLLPFEQLDNRFGRANNGTGLGLSLVQGFVQLHNGRLDIKSTPEKGSIFSIWLPPPPSDSQHISA